MKIEIRPEPFDPWQELADYQSFSDQLVAGSYGACASFVGTMRDFNEGHQVTSLFLEHYPEMTESQLQDIAQNAVEQHQLNDAVILHRVGEILPNDPIVLVAVWSAHRAAAFEACREMMEILKSKATFWKKEQLTDGVRWVDRNTPG